VSTARPPITGRAGTILYRHGTLVSTIGRRGAAALAAVVVLSACITGSEPVAIQRAAEPDPVVAAERVDADRFQTRWPIKRVVFILKENRSFDHLFGRFPRADGVTEADDRGASRPLTPVPDDHADIPHCYRCSLLAFNGGQMDGFSQGEGSERYAYTQFRRADIPNLWHLAEEFVLSDNFFASAMGSSFPNHLYAIAATSGGAHDKPEQDPGVLHRRLRQGYAKSWGCDAPEGTYVEVVDAEGEVERVPPCFDFLTEGDLLRRAGIPWAFYGATNTQYGYIWSSYSAIRRYRENPRAWAKYIRPVDRLLEDIERDVLPPVTWVTPRGEDSDHPGGNSWCQGYNWTTDVINALMSSPTWDETAIFLTWDDYGGYYDHVPPPQVDDFGFGMRVPLLTISPYAKRGAIDGHVGEFSSILRFIEDNWGLTQLTHRDRDARNLSYNFDFGQQPREALPEMPLRTCQGERYPDPPNLHSPAKVRWLPDQTQLDGSPAVSPPPTPEDFGD
jgi:phospholipase C